jgi:hypothetical protein
MMKIGEKIGSGLEHAIDRSLLRGALGMQKHLGNRIVPNDKFDLSEGGRNGKGLVLQYSKGNRCRHGKGQPLLPFSIQTLVMA